VSSAIFTGASSFAADLQSVITRAVSIATLPVTQLTNAQTELQDQATAMTELQSAFQALRDAVITVSDALGESSFEAQVSDSNVVSAMIGAGAAEGNYSIDVVDVGAYATSLSTAAWSPASGEHAFQVSIGTDKIDIDPADTSAASVAAAINSKAGTKVRATVVNVGSNTAPDYRISLQHLSLGDSEVDVLDNGVSMQTQKTTGRKAQYIVNNSGITVESSSRSAEIATGLTVTLVPGGAGVADITVTRSTSALAIALSDFADAYSSLGQALDGQRGQTDGALAGQSLVYNLQDTLSDIGGYASSSLSGGLGDLGLSVDSAGQMSFNVYKLMATDLTNAGGLTSFLGGAESGGFLKSVTDGLNAVLDSDTGILTTAQSSISDQITTLGSQIDEKQAAVDELQTRLMEQMGAADAAIASMEQSYQYLNSLFAAMKQNAASYE
jgi:flagellar hook-associated protein 2